jgi:hypothetical protein
MELKMQKILAFFIFVIFIMAGCATATPTPEAKRSEDFTFIFSDTPCGETPVDVFNSGTNTLIQTPLDGTKSTSISLYLTKDELDAIYQKAVETNFFYLPSKITPPDNPFQIRQLPSGIYELTMTNGIMKNSVSWKNDIITNPLYEEAAEFQILINFIRDIIRSHKEYQQLPGPGAVCI